jgi:IMP cyclohydrolase
LNNPNAPYPGRQLFLGLTLKKHPCFAYLVTGRSPESRERKAIATGDAIRIGPLGNQPFDPLRHYAAVKYDNASGIIAISNGIQTDAIYETYKLLGNTASPPAKKYLEMILEGAGAEPDSYHTPRIAGVITPTSATTRSLFIIGLKAHNLPAKGTILKLEPGDMIGISTYKGSLDSPEARDPAASLPLISIKGTTAAEIAAYVFDISAADYKGNDIRVSSVGGVRAENGSWQIAVKNVY